MNEIFYFFENITSQTRVFFLVGGLFLFLTLEFGIPFFKSPYDKLNHAKINITFTLITLIINLFGAIGILKSVDLVKTYNLGLLNAVEISLWLYVLIGIAVMDFIGAWFIHWIQHNVKWMWKFHIIHHSDVHVDVTSGLRHHPGENILRLFFTSLAVFIVGPTFGLVMLYQTISAFFAHLTHANIRMPLALDFVLSYIFVTPYFHKVHHHYEQPYTDTNYGNIFSFWDHIFGTAVYEKDLDKLVYGIDTHFRTEEHTSLKNLLMIPFQPYRQPVGRK